MARLVPEQIKPPVIARMNGRRWADVFRTCYRASVCRHLVKIGRTAGFERTETRMVVTSAASLIAAVTTRLSDCTDEET